MYTLTIPQKPFEQALQNPKNTFICFDQALKAPVAEVLPRRSDYSWYESYPASRLLDANGQPLTQVKLGEEIYQIRYQ